MAETAVLNMTTRGKEICGAVDSLIAVHDQWVADEHSSEDLPLSFESALLDCERAANGDVPGSCRELVDAISRLIFEWNAYAHGERSLGRPLPKFWGAFRAMLLARKGVEIRPPRRPEPVSLLVKQGVGYHQIAHHIWGHSGVGPFINEAGQPDIDLIVQEAESPGSVVPKSWIHPLEKERLAKQSDSANRRIQEMSRLDASDEVTIDAASVEDLLREGQFTSVIAKVKGITIDEVNEIADRLNINASDVPNLKAELPSTIDADSKSTQKRKAAQKVAQKSEESSSADDAELTKQVLSLVDSGNGTPEIKAILAAEGIEISGHKIGSILRWSRTSKQSPPPGGDVPVQSPQSTTESQQPDDESTSDDEENGDDI